MVVMGITRRCSAERTVEMEQASRAMVTRVHETLDRSPFSVVVALVPLAQQVAKRSRPFPDEASKDTGASSKSEPEGKRLLALASVRHQQSSQLISAEAWTESDVSGQ